MRIKALREAHNLTQDDLGLALGISGAAVAQWETGKTKPGYRSLHKMEERYGWLAKWLETGRGPQFRAQETSGINHIVGTDVPVIQFATLPVGGIGEAFQPATMARSWMVSPVTHGPRTFVFKMPDSSMADASEHSIPASHFVWVDPDQRSPEHESPVLVMLESGRYLVAQYMTQAGREWLRLLNAEYPKIDGKFEVVGRVIFSGRER